jgi:drug/metabolite transporter (DMT)-like permease
MASEHVLRHRTDPVDLLLIAVAIVWGSSYLSAKLAVTAAAVVVVLAWRFVITAGVLLAASGCLVRRRPDRREVAVAVLLGATQSAILVFETAGVARTSATNAGLIISLTLVVTPLVESFWSGRWLPGRFFAATALAMVGVALLVSGDLATPNLGDVLMLTAAVIRGFHVAAMGQLTRDHRYDSITMTTIQSVVCAVIFCGAAGRATIDAATGFSLSTWAALVYLGLLCGAFAFLVQIWAVRRTSATRASMLLGTEPIWAVLIGVRLGHEHLGFWGLAGGVLLVGGTWLAQNLERRHRTAELSLVAAKGPGTHGMPVHVVKT